jgi:predicted RNase H-like nuclease (RuvC/YqgF family)
MVTTFEECNTCEVLDHNSTIETLKKEIEVLGAEKTRLTVEVGDLSTAHAEAQNLWKEADSLQKQVEAAKSAEALAVDHTSKANETASNLHKEIDAEKTSSLALQQQVGLLIERLEATKVLGLSAAKMYVDALGQFGGSTSNLPEEPTTFSLLSWLKAHVEKLPAFVGGAVDFGAFSRGTNYAKMLA